MDLLDLRSSTYWAAKIRSFAQDGSDRKDNQGKEMDRCKHMNTDTHMNTSGQYKPRGFESDGNLLL